jgi:hypothetical protein
MYPSGSVLGVLAMLHGKTAEAIAIANTAILMELLERLVERGAFTKPDAIALLATAAEKLESEPNAATGRVVEAIRIIRRELIRRL